VDKGLADAVRRRAQFRCEYCLIPTASYPSMPFPIDHIIARKHDGPTALTNLALSCLHCNAHKGSNIAGRDPATRVLTTLFNPRRHAWAVHFRWDGPILTGRTPVGRVTIHVLKLNHPKLVRVRRRLLELGLFPPRS
jgi:hypothetical protein